MKTIEQTSNGTAHASGMKAISWSAVFSGAVLAAIMYLILMVLGAGLGLSVVSPWNLREYAPETIGIAAVAWIILTQIISSGGGGYIAGRLAQTESNADNQEVHFRNTAHGLVVWALTAIMVLMLVGTTISHMLSGGAAVISTVSKGVGLGVGTTYLGNNLQHQLPDSNTSEESEDISSYALDFLFRPFFSDANQNEPHPAFKSSDSSTQKTEIARIFAYSIQEGKMSDADKNYIAKVISSHTGLTQADALNRVNQTLSQIQVTLEKAEDQAKQALDSVRRAAVETALWTFAALIGGALAAGAAARFGGGSWGRRVASSSKVTMN